jgi:hypothetical protein
MSDLRQRPGDQQLPVPNGGPSMHDLVIADLDGWPEAMSVRNAIRDLLAERKRLGVERYGSLLQAGNGRDARRDLLEELADAAVYARQVQEERGDGPGSAEAFEAYEHITSALFWACKIPGAPA